MNRCNRSCYQCPICIAPLSLNSIQLPHDQRPAGPASRDGPYILSCSYCSWSTLDIGIKLDKSINISDQLMHIKNGGEIVRNTPPRKTRTGVPPDTVGELNTKYLTCAYETDPSVQYFNLATFFKDQLVETTPSGPFGLGHSFGFDSPSRMSHVLSRYGVGGLKKQVGKLPLMREANGEAEGHRIISQDDGADVISKMKERGWEGTTAVEQRLFQTNEAHLLSDVRPIATQLRSKRGKRCRTCRRHLVRPDDRRQGTRYKLRLVALNYIPRIKLKALDWSINHASLAPLKPIQFLLTFHNPLYDSVKITLATPPLTPGKVSSKVTILCPQFEIGANKDFMDEALESTNKGSRSPRIFAAVEGQQAEAGKVWAKGRNWTTVILEVVPGSLDVGSNLLPSKATSTDEESSEFQDDGDEGVLEVPVFVRMEYETEESSADQSIEDSGGKANKEKKVQRELAYWCVLGIGLIERFR